MFEGIASNLAIADEAVIFLHDRSVSSQIFYVRNTAAHRKMAPSSMARPTGHSVCFATSAHHNVAFGNMSGSFAHTSAAVVAPTHVAIAMAIKITAKVRSLHTRNDACWTPRVKPKTRAGWLLASCTGVPVRDATVRR